MGMSKEELIEAINGTLISNEEKAITADALRNLLTDIVENSGNGGGGGITFFYRVEQDENENFISILTPEQIAHNKEQIDILRQLHNEGKPIPPIAFSTNQIDGISLPGDSELMFSYLIVISWDGATLGEKP